jgi:hypothetical protein
MDRLTGWDKENAYYLKCFEGNEGGCVNMCSDECFKCEANYETCKRLAQYEDSGLSHEQVKALQLENEELRDKYAKLNDFEQSQCAKLLAQLGMLREAAKSAAEILQDMVDVAIVSGSACLYRRDTFKVIGVIKALSTAPTTYHNPADEFSPVNLNDVEPDKLPKGLFHNPADVEALAKAREALEAAWGDSYELEEAEELGRQALEQIDKAGGGQE